MDINEEQRLQRLLESVEKEERRNEERNENPVAIRRILFLDEPIPKPLDVQCSDDESEDNLEVLDDGSDSEQSGEEDNFNQIVGPEYTGKNNITKWNVHCPSQSRRTRAFNLIRRLPGVTSAVQLETPLSAWMLFFTDEILNDVLICTNQRIDKVRHTFARERDAKSMMRMELEALIGILYMAGVLHSSHLNLYNLWATEGTGFPFFRNCFNIRRFKWGGA
uniref:PiggyBac transposable element-derived protein domain-containing protein n=1 Tax=Clastoptera arizonana TaxID=38151 RepID=A0A1B6DAX7_9HEMI